LLSILNSPIFSREFIPSHSQRRRSMKILPALICTTIGGDVYKSCMQKSTKIQPGSVHNGAINCRGSTCILNCQDGYSSYGGYTRSKCVTNRRSGRNYWSRSKLGSCRTCEDLEYNRKEMNMDCSMTTGGTRKCVISCKNGQGIKPINNDKVVVICRCTFPPKSNAERDGKCHWRYGLDKIIDTPAFSRDYIKNWFCAKESKAGGTAGRETLGIEHAMAVSSRPPEHRIPPGLVCRGDMGFDRIVGGVAAIPHSWPWIVNMAFGQFMCGGTILDDETVLTAAHCCDGYQRRPKQVKGIIGDHNYHHEDLGEKMFLAKEVIVHQDYSRRTVVHDICIVKFENMNLSRRPIAAAACLPTTGSHPKAGTRCWTAGWGYTSEGKVAEQLQEVDLKIIDDAKCRKTQNGAFLVPHAMFCAGTFVGGKDACQGDSGGPLICADSKSQPIVMGVTSWGIGCGKANSPGVWTKVSSYIPWIKRYMMS